VEFIGAADIYLTPYLNPRKITSGPWPTPSARARPFVSTPYWYAEELLGEDARYSFLCRLQSHRRRVIELLDNDTGTPRDAEACLHAGSRNDWPRVAQRYWRVLSNRRRTKATTSGGPLGADAGHAAALSPPANLNHLRQMTDDTGLVPACLFTVPNYHEGYATDDNAAGNRGRLLKSAAKIRRMKFGPGLALLAFLINSFSSTANRFRNFLSMTGVGRRRSLGGLPWLSVGWGRSSGAQTTGLRGAAAHLFERLCRPPRNFASPRAWAFTLLHP